MGRNLRWGFAAVIVLSVSGCASLLGDFTTNGEAGGDDGGPFIDGSHVGAEGGGGDDDAPGTPGDGGAGDAAAGDDGSTNPTDASDAAVPPLACVEQGGIVRTKLATITRSSSNDNERVQLFNASSAGQTNYRALVAENPSSGPSVYHVYSFGSGGGSTNVTDIPVPVPSNGGNLLSVVRYPTGIAALVFAVQGQGTTMAPIIEVVRLEDGTNAWSSPDIVTALAPSSCYNRVVGALSVQSAPAQDYAFEVAFQTCTANQTVHLAGHATGGTVTNPSTWPLPVQAVEGVDAGGPSLPDAGAVTFDITGLVTSGGGLYSLTNVAGNNGPTPGVGSCVFTSTASQPTTATPRELPLTNDVDIMQGLSVAALPSGNVGVSILEANLSSQTVTPVIYTGSVSGAQMSTLVPSVDLHPTTFAGIQDLPINNAAYHWEGFAAPSASENLLAVAGIYPNNNGLDFLWMNAQGQVRGKRTGTNALFYDPAQTAPVFFGGDVTFSSPPFAALAGFELVFLQGDPEASTMTDVWATQINCTAP